MICGNRESCDGRAGDRRVLEAHVTAVYDHMMARPRGKRAKELKALNRLLRLLERAR